MGPEHKQDDSGSVMSKEKLSEELFYHGEKGDIEKCKELLNNGADVNWKANEKLWFRTPLMQAAKSGMTEVCRLYLEHGADINAFTVSHYTALILAARYGHTETCQFLLSKGANINNQTKDGETALMWAADHGHPATCKLLLEAGAKIDLQDKYGITALIRAAKGGHLQTCIVLLDFGAVVTAVSTLGNKVWDAEQWAKMNKHQSIVKLIQSYKIRCSLLKDGSDPPSYVTLNVCGAVNAGKTTLIRNLQLTAFQRRRHHEQPDTSQDMASRTAGIEVGIIDVPGAGVFRKMDMAGHSWAFTSNEYFIGKRTSISLVLFDLSKTDKEIENDLFHHLGCLKARETKCGVLRYRPEVVLIATHPDKLDTDPQPRANAYFRMAMDSFQAYMNFYPKVMVLNCTNPNILHFNALRECLKTLRGKIIKNSERVPRLCARLLPRIRALAKQRSSFPVVSWEEFFREVKEVNNAADEEGVRNVAFYLNESVEIVNDNSPELRDKVVLDVNWLTCHIFGIALAPSNFPRSLRFDRLSGMVEKAELQANFPECPLDQLVELFVRFEVCIPWDEHNILCENYLFPSHLEQDRSNLDDVWPQFGISDAGLCVVGRIVECKNKMDALPCGFFPKFQIRLLKRFGHKSPVWYGGIKIADDVVEILVTLSSSLTAVNVCVWAPNGCEERCYASMKFIETLMAGLRNEVAGGIEFVHKAMSIKMLHHKRFEGYLLKDVDEALNQKGPNARVALESCGLNELAVDVKYCGIRRYVHARDHISHMSLRDRKELAKLLDTDCSSNLSSLSEQLGVGSVPEENEDTGPSGFTSVIPKSETDHFLSLCALQPELKATRLIEALERMNRFEAANVVGRWLSSIDVTDDAMSMYKTRGESGASERSSSVSSRRRGTSGASEHCEMRTRSTDGSNASEGSSLGSSQHGPLSSVRAPCTCVCSRHKYDSSEHSFPFGMHRNFPRGERASSHSSVPDNTYIRRLINSERKMRSASEPSEHSCACSAEESCCAGSLERLSCEESQNGSTEQIVPQPLSRFIFEPCKNCQHCAPKLSPQETQNPKPCDSDLESTLSSPIQISQNDDEGETSKKESLPTAETGEPDMKTSFPPSSLVSELSSRLSLSWRPVARDLGFRNSDLSRFEEASLFRDQASTMLHCWLSNNSCTLECTHCDQVILERLGEAFENAHRADLKDLLEHSKET